MSTQDNPQTTTGNRETADNQQQFVIQKIYLKDLSFEAPMGAEAFMTQIQPQISQELGTDAKKIANDVYESVLKLTITAKQDKETAFLIEIQQSGIFLIKGFDEKNIAHILNTVCPQLLFPYAREVIDSTLVKGGFPALMLPPVNFEMLVAQAMENKKDGTEH